MSADGDKKSSGKKLIDVGKSIDKLKVWGRVCVCAQTCTDTADEDQLRRKVRELEDQVRPGLFSHQLSRNSSRFCLLDSGQSAPPLTLSGPPAEGGVYPAVLPKHSFTTGSST